MQNRLYRKEYPKLDLIIKEYDEFETTTIHFDQSLEQKYDESRLKKPLSQQQEYIPDKGSVDRALSDIRKWYTNDNTLLSALTRFLDYSEEFNELGLPLYRYFLLTDIIRLIKSAM